MWHLKVLRDLHWLNNSIYAFFAKAQNHCNRNLLHSISVVHLVVFPYTFFSNCSIYSNPLKMFRISSAVFGFTSLMHGFYRLHDFHSTQKNVFFSRSCCFFSINISSHSVWFSIEQWSHTEEGWAHRKLFMFITTCIPMKKPENNYK